MLIHATGCYCQCNHFSTSQYRFLGDQRSLSPAWSLPSQPRVCGRAQKHDAAGFGSKHPSLKVEFDDYGEVEDSFTQSSVSFKTWTLNFRFWWEFILATSGTKLWRNSASAFSTFLEAVLALI